VQIQRLSGWTMLCTRQMGPYAEVRFAWKQLAEWMQAHGIESANEARIGISHDDPAFVPPAKIRYDACRIVSAQLATELASDLCPPFHLQVMPSAEYAVTVHDGPYHELGRAYRRLFLHWLPSTGRYPAHAPVVERYLNSPLDVPETELRTELLLPLE